MSTRKMTGSFIIAFIYLVFSLVTIFGLLLMAHHFSGERFALKWFYLCFALTIISGTFQMSTVEFGYDISFPALKPILADNEMVRWIAFVSVFLHMWCLPDQREPKRWFLRKALK